MDSFYSSARSVARPMRRRSQMSVNTRTAGPDLGLIHSAFEVGARSLELEFELDLTRPAATNVRSMAFVVPLLC